LIDGLADLVEIGHGGFGIVYRARQVDLGRPVAVKVLTDVRGDSDAYARFARECQALAALGGHPNIATVFGCGLTEDGSGYLSMELLPGGSLADKVADGPSSWQSVATWGVQLAGALETAHRAGITHRDMKPENVLFDGLGSPKLVDFGIASVPGAYRTATGAVTLTLAHAAPEVVAGRRGGVSGDVYALASTLYAALAGHAAFVAEADETMVPMLARIASAPVPDLRPSGVPDAVCFAIERGMAKDPADRPVSAEAFGVALHDALATEGVSSPTPPLLLPGMAVAAFDADPAAASTASGYVGDQTITGWDAAAASADEATVRTQVVEGAAARRRTNAWAIVAGLAVIALGLVAFRGLVGPSVASPAASPSGSSSQSPTPTPGASGSRSPTPSSGASATRSGTSAASGSSHASSPSRSSAPAVPVTSPSSQPTPSSTPTPLPMPGVPRTVHAAAPSVTGVTGGANSVPREITLTVSWLAPASGPTPTGYDVRWVVVGGPQTGTATSATSTGTLSARVAVPAPASGWYRWQVRSRLGSTTSAWVTARVVVPNVMGRRMSSARYSLRAIGLTSTVYNQPTSAPKQIGRVVAQSLARGRVVVGGTSIALGKGVKA
jgi:serine/threonine protein kinase